MTLKLLLGGPIRQDSRRRFHEDLRKTSWFSHRSLALCTFSREFFAFPFLLQPHTLRLGLANSVLIGQSVHSDRKMVEKFICPACLLRELFGRKKKKNAGC